MLFVLSSSAQQSFQYIISSAGSYAKGGGQAIYYTIGQYVVFQPPTIHNNLQTEVSDNYIADLELKVYPNPAQNYVNVKLKNLHTDSYQLKIFDLMGSCVLRSEMISRESKKKIKELDLSEIKPGQYLIHLTNTVSGQHEATAKIIKL